MEVLYSKAARQALIRSNKRKVLVEKIGILARDPDALANNVTQLKGRREWRLRVQDWRVIYIVEDGILLVRDIAPRGAVYED